MDTKSEKIRHLLSLYFPYALRYARVFATPHTIANEEKKELTSIYKRLKNICELIISDQNLKTLRSYVNNREYQQDVSPFDLKKLLQNTTHIDKVKQMNYHPNKYLNVYKKLYNIIDKIEDALDIPPQKQFLYHFDINQIMPTRDIHPVQTPQYMYKDILSLKPRQQQLQHPPSKYIMKRNRQQPIQKMRKQPTHKRLRQSQQLPTLKRLRQNGQQSHHRQGQIEKLKSLIPKKNISSVDKRVGKLTYNRRLLQSINEKCLKENEKIIILGSDDAQTIHIDYWPSSDENYYILLYINDKLVSQIHYGFDKRTNYDVMIISSDTLEDHRGQHYNTILRAATLILLPTMRINGDPIITVKSQAQNPLSVYLLLKLGFDVGDVSGIDQDDEFDVYWYKPSQKQNQTQHQKQKRLKGQHQLKKHLFDIDTNSFQVWMVLEDHNFEKSSKLAKIILKRLRNCSL